MVMKNLGRERKSKSTIKCPYCKVLNDASEMDYETVGKIKVFYCLNCGEEITENLKLK